MLLFSLEIISLLSHDGPPFVNLAVFCEGVVSLMMGLLVLQFVLVFDVPFRVYLGKLYALSPVFQGVQIKMIGAHF